MWFRSEGHGVGVAFTDETEATWPLTRVTTPRWCGSGVVGWSTSWARVPTDCVS